MKESTRTALLVTARTLVAAVCLTLVVTARTTVGWGNLLTMLAALAGLLALLAAYNRRFR
ncbi:hypothetical protein Sipo8835_00990 [Streptomyces ipomoeae]|jgi:hypothetical protein|uniref:Uncharacterized protein n=2 Tax=Streptomyces ipomoeae TaxID=103232 RepID=L1L8W6_9ACTN|nr:hypothetical protein [Streptomyces ipomoeae]EKX69068.1 hypothetical protein STRIP9103_07959 [Streptomyces ipomoeae 91-03]MDX2698888.1 hypothetical protein [Streptomyces ipomoeae]MDX2823228.1 hypothetical protein [Streptomyces ipomoeae]MDX2841426.1 hypothetical protein [Streptomyces ipomoeae]MDX2878959.1 hypothetical protein [Streptomyces ipomoeae]